MTLRSDAWLTGDDEVAHGSPGRASPRPACGRRRGGRPVIGIANSASDLNPCNLPLRELAGAVARGVREAGGIPAEFGIDLARRRPDEADRHAVPQPARDRDRGDDPRPPAGRDRHAGQLRQDRARRDHGRDQRGHPHRGGHRRRPRRPPPSAGSGSAPAPRCGGSGTSAAPAVSTTPAGGRWRAAWPAAPGACNTMGTASTVALLAEALGLMIPGSSHDPGRRSARPGRRGRGGPARGGGGRRRACALGAPVPRRLRQRDPGPARDRRIHQRGDPPGGDRRPGGRRRCPWTILARLGADVPVLADVQPSGAGLMQDFDAAGGLPALLRELSAAARGRCRHGHRPDHRRDHRGRARARPRRGDQPARPAAA